MPEEVQPEGSKERERIAADLHDRVIQKVFAAGLQLQGIMHELGDDQRRQVTEVMGELDGAIIALRGAIADLTEPSPGSPATDSEG